MIKLFFGFMFGLVFGVVITLFSVEKYYDYREEHESLFSGTTMNSAKQSAKEAWVHSTDKVKETYEHSKESVKDWIG